MSKKTLPEILHSQWVSHSRLFHVEELKLRFSNGVERIYERLNPNYERAVMVVPFIDDETVMLIREYGAGVGKYYLSLPKGAMHPGETIEEAANRELQEEAGYAAHRISFLKQLALSPSYMGNRMNILVAHDLYPATLDGDEPEPLEHLPTPISELPAMMFNDEFMESYAVAAIYLALHKLDLYPKP